MIPTPSHTKAGKVTDESVRESSFTTAAQQAIRRNGAKRLLGASVLALIGLLALMVFGPDRETVKKRFEYYGAPDELHIMNEISIEEGHDLVEKMPKSLRVPPPPAKLEIEQEEPDSKGFVPVNEQKKSDHNQEAVNTQRPQEIVGDSDHFQVEMSLPMQTSRDLFLLKKILPEYPLTASELERRTPVIVVQMNIFVDPNGDVTAAMIQASNGSRIFDEAALAAVRQWKFGWRVPPGAGRWVQFPFNFKSPYFSPGR